MKIIPWPESCHRLLGGLLLSGDRALRALAGTSIGLGALAAHRKSLTVTLALVAVDLNLATNICIDFTTQVTLDLVVGFEVVTQRNQLLVGEILDADVRANTCLLYTSGTAVYRLPYGYAHCPRRRYRSPSS